MQMETLPDMDAKERLNMELDLRLAQIWIVAEREGGVESLTESQIGQLLRASYGRGYSDALTEKNAGQLLKDAPGFKIQGRRR